MTGTSFSAGKICARLDYSSLSPVATGVSEVLQTSHGPFASCNISQAGDYIVLQLSYRLRAVAQEEYHSWPGSRGAWAPLLAKISTDPSSSAVWSRRLQLAAACLAVGFLLVFVCVARFMFRKNDSTFDEEDLPMDGFESGFGWQDRHPLTAFGRTSKGGPVSGDPGNQQGSSSSDLLDNREFDSSTSLHQDSIEALPRLNKRKRWGALGKAITAAKLLQMDFKSPKVKNVSRQLSVASLPCPSGTNETEVTALDENHISVMKQLMEMDALRGRDSNGRTALHIAALKDNLTAVRSLLDREDGFADVRHRDYHGQNPIHVAAKEGHDDIVADLVMHCYMFASMRPPSAGSGRRRRSFSVNQQDLDGNTPLHLAAESGHVDVIRALERTAESSMLDLGIENSNGWTPLQVAALNGHIEAVMRLVKLKPKAAFPRAPVAGSLDRDTSSLTPLHIASKHGHVRLVRCLLDWMKEHEDILDEDSSDDDELGAEESGSSLSQTQGFAALSFRLLKNMAYKSKEKLQALISFERLPLDVLDSGLEISPFSTGNEVEDPLASEDTKPLMQRQMGTGPSDLEHEVASFVDEGATRPSMIELVDPRMNSKDPAAGDAPGDATMFCASGAEESCLMPSVTTIPVEDFAGNDADATSDTEILPAPADDAAPEERDPCLRNSPSEAPPMHRRAPAVRSGKAADAGSSGLSSAPKSTVVDQKKSRRPGIPMAAKPRPKVAARDPVSSSASGSGSSGKPRRTGQQGKASKASSTARGPPASATKTTASLHAMQKQPINAAGAAASRPLGQARIQAPSKGATGESQKAHIPSSQAN